jgi:hypothetical protein
MLKMVQEGRTDMPAIEDNLQAGVEAKVTVEMGPLLEKCDSLRAALAVHAEAARRDCERRVRNAIFAVLGMPEVPEASVFAESKVRLVEQLTSFARHMGLELALPLVPGSLVEPLSSSVEPTPSSSIADPVKAPPRLERRAARPEDVEAAWKLVEEIEVLRSDVTAEKYHHTRLGPLLQAVVAEVRIFQDRLPPHHEASERLGSYLPVLGALKTEGGVTGFIRGLAFGSTGDWENIARKCRRKVADYDRDAEKPVTPSRRPSQKEPVTALGAALAKAKLVEDKKAPAAAHSWPKLPLLRALEGPILLAGGMLVPEKIVSIKERFGFDVEWHVIDHDSPRGENTLEKRVRAGKVGAVILLEGVMRHSTWKSIVDACDNASVAYAMGDKAGTASLEAAFNDLERKLGAGAEKK